MKKRIKKTKQQPKVDIDSILFAISLITDGADNILMGANAMGDDDERDVGRMLIIEGLDNLRAAKVNLTGAISCNCDHEHEE